MGLLKVGVDAASSVLADQWREYFYCDALGSNTLAVKGQKKNTKGNNKGTDNVISNGSVIAVNDGQCMIIVENGAIVDVCADAGEYVYDTKLAPTIFTGGLWQGIKDSFNQWKKRVTMAGETADQRVYYFNTKEIIGNKYGTANPVPFRVVDRNIGLDIDISVACHGEYAYKMQDPILFYKNLCGNVETNYTRDKIDSQLKSELLTALQPAFAAISEKGVRYSAVPAHADDLAEELNKVLSTKWAQTYGIVISSFGISTLKASAEDEERIKDLQANAVLQNPSMAAATLTAAQAQAMKDAARNENAGPMMAFAGMNMAAGQNTNTAQLFQMGAQYQAQQAAQTAPAGQAAGQPSPTQGGAAPQQAPAGQPAPAQGGAAPAAPQQAPAGQSAPAQGTPDPSAQEAQAAPQNPAGAWVCPSCGKTMTSKFCPDCGTTRPILEWTCPTCGKTMTSKFCPDCGTSRPE